MTSRQKLNYLCHRFSVLPLWFCAALIAMVAINAAWGADEEYLGRLAENDDQLTNAYTHYFAALQNAPEESEEELRLQRKLIKLVAKFDSSFEVPAEAKE